MEMTPAIATTQSNPKSPHPESDVPIRIQTTKPVSFTNGVLKRHQRHGPVAFTYKECLKNHAASIGGHALDGCGEFMPSASSNPSDPTSLKCAACGCHRNFHRREPDDLAGAPAPPHGAIEFQSHHRHHPLPPPPPPSAPRGSPSSASPPPISSSYMLLALSGSNNNNNNNHHHQNLNLGISDLNFRNHSNSGSKKRFRTKFSQYQKERMFEFSERVGWKMQKRDDEAVKEFCREIGVDRGVLKVWMHNNKNTFGRRSDHQHQNQPSRITSIDQEAANADSGHRHNGNDDNNANNNSNNNDVNENEGYDGERGNSGGRNLNHRDHHGFESDSGGADHGGANENGSSSSS